MPYQEHPNFESFLNEKIRERGFSPKKLSELSGIALKHLENLIAGRYENLPPAPYLHGYLKTLGQVLDFDPEEAWQGLKKDGVIKKSGADDQLPKNRFAREPLYKKILIFGGLSILLIYFILRFSQISGRPTVTVYFPENDSLIVTSEKITVTGKLQNGDQIFINNEPAFLKSDNSWEKEIVLQPGLNAIEIKGAKTLGRETLVVRKVTYEVMIETIAPTSTLSL